MSRFSIDGGDTRHRPRRLAGAGLRHAFVPRRAGRSLRRAGQRLPSARHQPGDRRRHGHRGAGGRSRGTPRPLGGGVDLGAYESLRPDLRRRRRSTRRAVRRARAAGMRRSVHGCQQCRCAPLAAVCGDALVCGGEQCEQDGDCGGGTGLLRLPVRQPRRVRQRHRDRAAAHEDASPTRSRSGSRARP